MKQGGRPQGAPRTSAIRCHGKSQRCRLDKFAASCFKIECEEQIMNVDMWNGQNMLGCKFNVNIFEASFIGSLDPYLDLLSLQFLGWAMNMLHKKNKVLFTPACCCCCISQSALSGRNTCPISTKNAFLYAQKWKK